MALTRREFLYAIPICASAIIGCSARSTRPIQPSQLRQIAATNSARQAAPTILVCMPETPQTRDVWKGLSDELARDYQLIAVKGDRATDFAIIAESIKRYQPVALVLMNNPTVTAYRDYQQNTARLEFPPAVVVMTSFLESQAGQLISTTGISYEVPLITLMTNLRKLVVMQRERVGVVVREPLRAFVDKQVQLARREQIVVFQESVSASPNASELKRALRRLKQQADVLWILNDDLLLTPRLISEGWLPGLDERPWIPAIVGAASLVSPERSFGTLAVLPDHVAMGAQAAGLLLDIADAHWTLPPGVRVELPLSTTTTLDLAQVKERFSLQKDALEQVDRILE
jgi:hypothetical protein